MTLNKGIEAALKYFSSATKARPKAEKISPKVV